MESPGPLDLYVQQAFPRARILETEPLTEGLRNTNFKLRLDSLPEPVVLRIYRHQPVLCRKELDLLQMVRATVPVPEVLHAEPDSTPPFAFLRWVEGITFRELRRGRDPEAVSQAARSIGEVLARIHQYRFPEPGWLSAGPTVTEALLEGEHAMARFVDLCLESANLQARLPERLRDAVHSLMWSRLDELSFFEQQSHLLHGDFSRRNIVVRESQGRWAVAAILDWEFAVAGTPLGDFGNFLRYDRPAQPAAEPFFSQAYRSAGGILPDDWRCLTPVVDLVALCEKLARDRLPAGIVPELAELIRAIVEDPLPS